MCPESLEADNNMSDPMERYGKIGAAYAEDCERMKDPVKSRIDAIRWIPRLILAGAVATGISTYYGQEIKGAATTSLKSPVQHLKESVSR